MATCPTYSRPSPRNFGGDEFQWGTTPSAIATSIAHGRSEIMPAFDSVLSEEEIWTIAYVVWRWIPREIREVDTPETAHAWKLR